MPEKTCITCPPTIAGRLTQHLRPEADRRPAASERRFTSQTDLLLTAVREYLRASSNIDFTLNMEIKQWETWEFIPDLP